MKAYVGVDLEIHIFLTSALAGGEWSVSRPGHFTPLDRRPGGSGRRGEEKILDPTETQTPTPRPSSPQLVPITTALSRFLFLSDIRL
jgi:hypothetical protein